MATALLVFIIARHDALAVAKPFGLLCDYQKAPALGVRTEPYFSWIVPPCSDGPDHVQTAYQILVQTPDQEGGPQTVWDSGQVQSNNSIYVKYGGPTLVSGTRYQWRVTTWTAGPNGKTCASSTSSPADFVTALNATNANLTVITGKWEQSVFGYFRKEAQMPSERITSATGFVIAPQQDPLLNGFKLFIDGSLAGLGPGRAGSAVWDGNGNYYKQPIITLDLSEQFAGRSANSKFCLAFQIMAPKQPFLYFRLQFVLISGKIIELSTDSSWLAFNGDTHRKPGPATQGHSAGTGFLEYIDARMEPAGWQKVGYQPHSSDAWSSAVIAKNLPFAISDVHAKIEPPMVSSDILVDSIQPTQSSNTGTCGIVSEGGGGKAGQPLHLACPGGTKIQGIKFASFGTPTGTCPGHLKKGDCDSKTTLSIVEKACIGKTECILKADRTVFGDPCYDTVKQLAVEISCPSVPGPTPPTPSSAPLSYLAIFEKEFQGGLRLAVQDGQHGQTVHIKCGESLKGYEVGTTWGWEFTWTLRSGVQTLEQHKYMECRFVSIQFSSPAPKNFTLSAWETHYPFDERDSAFTSSNSTLNAVWDLARYTLNAASMDTYTDSNTRERRPYEADGIIAATARLLVQRDYLWPRYSHAWVIHDPTWPVEWKQISPFLGWQDYMATGQPDLSLAFIDEMHDRTMIGHLDSTGLLDTSNMGRHIVDWMPDGSESDQTVKLGEFTASSHMSVSNMFAVRGLEILSEIVGKGGQTINASQFAREASNLKKAIVAKMWNGTSFCDGICSEVKGNSLVMTNMFALNFGMVPQEYVATAWNVVTNWGIENIGDYGAFWYQLAVSSGYYAPEYNTPPSDDGSAMLTALTKCDHYSWCSGLRDDNLTMTRESWHDGTYSHQWGASPPVGIAFGIMGLHQTAPAFASFTVKPKISSLKHASITIPTIRGSIQISAKPNGLDVVVPCGSRARLCLPRSISDTYSAHDSVNVRLVLDNTDIQSVVSGGHLCAAEPVGCGVGGTSRQLRLK